MPTQNDDDQNLTTGQIPGAIPDDIIEAGDDVETKNDKVSEVAMRINLLGKLVIPPPAP